MRKIGTIFKQDLKRMTTNIPTFIIVCGLLILPSLYAWFNIKANWDPYGATGGIKVAVVNEDQGTILLDEPLNIGNQVIEELQKNTKLGWEFVGLEDAEYGVRSGKYYAYIKIPSTFTEDLKSITTQNQQKPTLVYVINEKSNAIAPKITSSGANSLKATVSENIITTANEVIFEAFNQVGFSLEENMPQLKDLALAMMELDENREQIAKDITRYYEGIVQAEEVLETVGDKLPLAEDTVIQIGQVAANAQEALEGTSEVLRDIGDTTENTLNEMENIAGGVIDFVEQVKTELSNSEAVYDTLQDIQGAVGSLKKMNQNVMGLLSVLKLPHDSLKNLNISIKTLEAELNTASDMLVQGKEEALSGLETINIETINIKSTITESLTFFQNELRPQINRMINQTTQIAGQVSTLGEDVTLLFPKLENVEGLGIDALQKGEKVLNKVQEQLPTVQDELHRFAEKLSFFQNGEELDSLIELLETNPELIAKYIASPVVLEEEALYPIPNYGSAMTPFYTVLAIWVGIVILSAMLTTESALEDVTPREEYIGKGMTYLFLSLIQSLIIALGDLFIVKVYVSNKLAFILLSLVSAFVFTCVIYTLVALFGNLGKGIVIILLVLQISSAGGTFPIEVIPSFFRIISRFVPFTYAIGTLREAQGGIFYPNLYNQLIHLAIFAIVFLLVGLLFKKSLKIVHELFNEKFKLSGLGE